MSLDLIVVLLDLIAFVGFVCAGVIVLRVPAVPGGTVNSPAKYFMATATFLLALVAFGNMIEHGFDESGAIFVFDRVTDYAVVLFVPFSLYGVSAMYAAEQVNDAERLARQMKQGNDFLSSIVDTTPAGVIVMDAFGGITFANESARALLDLEEDDSCGLVWPGWSVRDERPCAADDEPRGDFGAFVGPEPHRDVPVSVEWPTGWRVTLSVSTAPMYDAEGRVGGVVGSFVQRTT